MSTNDSNSINSSSSSQVEFDYVNHELSTTLDSTNAFEGPEKLLEVWFSESPEKLPSSCPSSKGLRSIPLNEIENLLDLVNCKILSKISTKEMDAYLLSESSLFVFPHKMILKTCGTTITLFCLSKLKELAMEYLKISELEFKNIYRCFYSRRSLMFPQRQNEIHQSWSNELSWLNKYFTSKTGKAYVIGDLTKDHWYFYMNGVETTGQNQRFSSIMNSTSTTEMYPISPVISNDSDYVFSDENEYVGSSTAAVPQTQTSPVTPQRRRTASFVDSSANFWKASKMDETFELLMSEISPEQAKYFQLSRANDQFPTMDPETEDVGHLLGAKMMSDTGLDSIFAKSVATKIKHDAFAFTPCGFSSNSIINGSYYYTLHITPEEGWSYASFETNLPNTDKLKLTRNVIDVLKPGKFCLVFVQELDGSAPGDLSESSTNSFDSLAQCDVPGYDRIDKTVLDLKFNYKLLYSYYEKN